MLRFWFIHEGDPAGFEAMWSDYINGWLMKVDETNSRYKLDEFSHGPLRGMNAEEYLDTERLDYDSLSEPRMKPKVPEAG